MGITVIRRAIAPPRLFDARDYGNGTLRGWFSARQLAGRVANLGAIDTWEDISGNGNHATQSGGNRPTFQANALGGMPGVLFTRTSTQSLVANGLAAVQSGTNLPYTLAVVFRQTSTAVTQMIAAWGDSVSGNSIVYHQHTGGGNYLHRRRDSSASNKQYGGTAIDTNLHIMVWRFDGSNGQYWRDGVILAGPTDLATAGALTADRFSLGNNPGSGGGGAPFDGYQFDVVIWASALSDLEARDITRTLSREYSLLVQA